MKKRWLFTSVLWTLAMVATLASGATWSAEQKVYKFDIQTAVPSSSLYFQLTQKLAAQLEKMSSGRLKAEVLPDGAVVKAFDILDAVSSGTVKGGMVWPHYWSGKNSAYVLFSNPPASTGLDQRSFMAWYYQGGGQELYTHLEQDIQHYNVVPFLIQPMGPDPLGWFKQPIKTMDDFRKLKYRAPPGIAGQTYKEMGVSAVAMPGGDIVPSAQRGVIDAAEWIGPADDRNLGLQKIWKYYYLQGLHQQTDVAELIFNKQFWESLPPDLQEMIRVAVMAQVAETLNANVYQNALAVRQFEEKDGVKVLDAPQSYYAEFIAAQKKVTAEYAKKNPFFKKVLESQEQFAQTVYPYWSKILVLYTSLVNTAHEEQMKK